MIKMNRWGLVSVGCIAAMALMGLIVMWMLTFNLDPDTNFITITVVSLNVMSLVVCIILFFTILLDSTDDRGLNYFQLMVFVNASLLFTSFLAWLLDGQGEYATLMFVSNNVTCVLFLTEFLLFWIYLMIVIGERNPVIARLHNAYCAMYAVGIIMVVLNVLGGFLFYVDPDGFLHLGDAMLLIPIPSLFMMVVALITIYLFVPGRRKRFALLCFVLLPILAYLVDILGLMTTFSYVAITLSLTVLYGNFCVSRSEYLVQKDVELVQQRATVLVSQIQPHFLYNSLTSLMNIRGNPPETRDAIADFGKFLRGNLDTLTQRTAIPLMKEIDHVETYILLEKLEMKERLNLVMDLKDRTFLIPSLTIQALVENSVVHGLWNKPEGGTIRISTYSTVDDHVLTICDDGVGFETGPLSESDELPHVGLNSVRMRLKDMVNGRMEVRSEIGKGTEIIITIPKNNGQSTRSESLLGI